MRNNEHLEPPNGDFQKLCEQLSTASNHAAHAAAQSATKSATNSALALSSQAFDLTKTKVSTNPNATKFTSSTPLSTYFWQACKLLLHAACISAGVTAFALYHLQEILRRDFVLSVYGWTFLGLLIPSIGLLLLDKRARRSKND